MYLLANFEDQKSYRNGNTNSYTDTLEKAELTTSICHIGIFLKSGIPVYNSEVLDTVGKKIIRRKRRRRTQAIAKRYAFHANAITKNYEFSEPAFASICCILL